MIIGMGQEYSTQAVPAIKAGAGTEETGTDRWPLSVHDGIGHPSPQHQDDRPVSRGSAPSQQVVAMSNVSIVSHPELLHWILDCGRHFFHDTHSGSGESEERDAATSYAIRRDLSRRMPGGEIFG